MIGKILFTIVVILVVLVIARGRMRGKAPTGSVTPQTPTPKWPRFIAYGFLAAVIGVGVTFYYLDWQERNEVLSVKVINSRTGLTTQYHVSRGEMRGRTFTTLDGVTVTLSEEERVEVIGRQ